MSQYPQSFCPARSPARASSPYLTLAPAVLLVLLGACSGTARIDAPVNPEWEQRRLVLADISHWEFTGSINVRDASDSHASRIRWQQNGDVYRINLWGTFNVGATQIDGRPGEVMIVQQGHEPVVTETPETLLYQELGYELPVSELNYWIKGIPAPGLHSQMQFSENNQVMQFQQAGWQVDYMAYTNYGTETLPTRIRMQKHPLRLDLTRLNWNLPEPGK